MLSLNENGSHHLWRVGGLVGMRRGGGLEIQPAAPSRSGDRIGCHPPQCDFQTFGKSK